MPRQCAFHISEREEKGFLNSDNLVENLANGVVIAISTTKNEPGCDDVTGQTDLVISGTVYIFHELVNVAVVTPRG